MSLNAISEGDIKKYKKLQKEVFENNRLDNNTKMYTMILVITH